MRKTIFALSLISITIMTSCTLKKEANTSNPILSEYKTPFGVPPFNDIKVEHYMPAFLEGMKAQKEEIKAIVENKEVATFENTLVALDRSGSVLTRVSSLFSNQTSAETNDELQKLAQEISPLLSAHGDDIAMNMDLFKRVKTVYDSKSNLTLNTEQSRLLDKIYKDFVRGGANLPQDKQARLRKINEELSMLSIKFGDNVLAENNRFKLFVDNKEDIAGLPESIVATAADAAKQNGQEGKWMFTISKPSLLPFLTYSPNRQLREKMFKGYVNKGDNNDSIDNKTNAKRIVELRIEKANLMGYASHADFVLEETMAKNAQNVYDLLLKVWTAAIPVAKAEVAEMQKIIDKEGGKFKLAPWDWWYYAEKVRLEKYNLSEEELMPYFEMNNVRNGVFEVAQKLFGITFTENKQLPVYHADVTGYEVREADGTLIGIFYSDPFVRPGKRGGAWMSDYRAQAIVNGKNIEPVIVNVLNYARPSETTPSLLSLDDVTTIFHEFGHALHGLLTKCNYYTLSGTSVARDFVELPSQVMEHWATEPTVLKMYAKHYKTGEIIPDALIEKIEKSGYFNQGFNTVEFVGAGLLDMDYSTLQTPLSQDINTFENSTLYTKYGMIAEIVSRYRTTYFNHIFGGGYSAGYYSYLWAEVLDADAFEAFKETSLFDKTAAEKLRRNILEKGNTEDPMTLYVNFRGKKPGIEPLLRNRGLLK